MKCNCMPIVYERENPTYFTYVGFTSRRLVVPNPAVSPESRLTPRPRVGETTPGPFHFLQLQVMLTVESEDPQPSDFIQVLSTLSASYHLGLFLTPHAAGQQ